MAAIFLLVTAGAARADDVEIAKWVTDRGASADALAPYQNGMCAEVVVGPKHEPAIQCYEQEEVSRAVTGEDVPALRIFDHYVLRVVRDKKLVTLIDAPVKAEIYDAMPRPPNRPAPPWHPFELASDGKSLVVGDPQDAEACKRAVVRTGTTKFDRVQFALDRDLHDRICKARGRYVWSNGRFTAARKT